MAIHPIGIIVGRGSGPKLAEIFVRFLRVVGEKYDVKFEFYINDYPEPLDSFEVRDTKKLGI